MKRTYLAIALMLAASLSACASLANYETADADDMTDDPEVMAGAVIALRGTVQSLRSDITELKRESGGKDEKPVFDPMIFNRRLNDLADQVKALQAEIDALKDKKK